MAILLAQNESLDHFVRIDGLNVTSINHGESTGFLLGEAGAKLVINNILEALGYPKIDVYRAEADGVTVIHVDTEGLPENDQGPQIRIYLNDQPIEENPVYPGLPIEDIDDPPVEVINLDGKDLDEPWFS